MLTVFWLCGSSRSCLRAERLAVELGRCICCGTTMGWQRRWPLASGLTVLQPTWGILGCSSVWNPFSFDAFVRLQPSSTLGNQDNDITVVEVYFLVGDEIRGHLCSPWLRSDTNGQQRYAERPLIRKPFWARPGRGVTDRRQEPAAGRSEGTLSLCAGLRARRWTWVAASERSGR
jgi:hypothetical protein